MSSASEDQLIGKEHIMSRVPPGDRWQILGQEEVYDNLTDALQGYFEMNGACEFYLAPLDSKVYKILETEPEPEKPQKKLSIYGE